MPVAPIGTVGRELVTALAVITPGAPARRLPIARPVQTAAAPAAPADFVLRGASGAQIQAYAAAFAAAAAAATVTPVVLPTPRPPRVGPVTPLARITRIDVYA